MNETLVGFVMSGSQDYQLSIVPKVLKHVRFLFYHRSENIFTSGVCPVWRGPPYASGWNQELQMRVLHSATMWPEVADELMIYKCLRFGQNTRKFESCLTCNEISFKAAWLKKEPHFAECDFKSQELFQSFSVFLTGKYKGQVMMDNCIISASPGETVMAPCSFTKMEL